MKATYDVDHHILCLYVSDALIAGTREEGWLGLGGDDA